MKLLNYFLGVNLWLLVFTSSFTLVFISTSFLNPEALL